MSTKEKMTVYLYNWVALYCYYRNYCTVFVYFIILFIYLFFLMDSFIAHKMICNASMILAQVLF